MNSGRHSIINTMSYQKTTEDKENSHQKTVIRVRKYYRSVKRGESLSDYQTDSGAKQFNFKNGQFNSQYDQNYKTQNYSNNMLTNYRTTEVNGVKRQPLKSNKITITSKQAYNKLGHHQPNVLTETQKDILNNCLYQ